MHTLFLWNVGIDNNIFFVMLFFLRYCVCAHIYSNVCQCNNHKLQSLLAFVSREQRSNTEESLQSGNVFICYLQRKRKYEQCAICVSQTSPWFHCTAQTCFLFLFFQSDFSGLTHCLRLGKQEISERTLMHRSHTQRLDYAFRLLLSGSCDRISFQTLLFVSLFLLLFYFSWWMQALIEVSHFPFLPFFMNVIYCTCNEMFFFIATFNSRSFGVETGVWISYVEKLRKLLSKPKCVFHQ